MERNAKTREELLAEIADLRERLQVLEASSQHANNNRVGRERAEEALKKAENGQKKAQNALTQSELQVTSLTSQLLLAEEQERKRIARELHDGLGQSLNAIAVNLKTTLQKVNNNRIGGEFAEEALKKAELCRCLRNLRQALPLSRAASRRSR